MVLDKIRMFVVVVKELKNIFFFFGKFLLWLVSIW